MSEALVVQTFQGEIPANPAAEERAWVERTLAGDLAAFDAIMARYEARLLRFLIGMVGDGATAQDLCQETFLAAYRALPRLSGELHLSAWLHTIALNQARSHHRRHHRHQSLEGYDPPGHDPDLQETAATRDLVHRALARLPERYAGPLLLQLNGLSCREIAAILHSSEGAIRVRLLRAREAFRRAYQLEGEA